MENDFGTEVGLHDKFAVLGELNDVRDMFPCPTEAWLLIWPYYCSSRGCSHGRVHDNPLCIVGHAEFIPNLRHACLARRWVFGRPLTTEPRPRPETESMQGGCLDRK